MGLEQVHTSPRQGRHFILLCVSIPLLSRCPCRELTQSRPIISTVLNTLIAVLNILDAFPQGGVGEVIAAVTSIPLYNMTSRFVMNIRELYALDSAGRLVRDIDVGFGLSSEGGRDVGGSTTIGSIAFAEVGGSGGLEDDIVEIAALESEEQS